MRKFAFAIIVAVFMAGCAQPVVKEEVKPAVPPVVKPAVPPAVPPVAVVDPATYALSKEDFEKCRQIYFDRCAGCHGVLRKGATGAALTPDKTRAKGAALLRAFIYTGTGGGMPGWGKGWCSQQCRDRSHGEVHSERPACSSSMVFSGHEKDLESVGPAREAPHCAAAQARLAELLRRDSARLWSDSDY